jgi:hypothetical protein
MALILKNGAVFLHVPKTGGNWIATVLQELNLVERQTPHKHADIDHFSAVPQASSSVMGRGLRALRYNLRAKPFMFCFVRDPLDWYESWFRYMSQPSRRWRNWGDPGDVENWHPNAMLNGAGSADFNDFVRNVLARRPGFVTEMYGWYDRPQVNFVGRQEHLVDDLVKVLRKMDLAFDEDAIRRHKKVGVSPIPEKPIFWDPAVRRQAALCEYAGLVRYGYQSTIESLGLSGIPLTRPKLRGVESGLEGELRLAA